MAVESITPSARSEEISLPFFDTSKSAILQSSAFVTATSLSAVYDLFSLPHSTFTFNIIRRLRGYSPEKSLSSNSSCECSREAIKPSLPQFMPSIGFSNSQPLREHLSIVPSPPIAIIISHCFTHSSSLQKVILSFPKTCL